VDIERIATVRTVANFFMIYLFFLFWSEVNFWKTTGLLMRLCEEAVSLQRFKRNLGWENVRQRGQEQQR
jgi:hypothetical protein